MVYLGTWARPTHPSLLCPDGAPARPAGPFAVLRAREWSWGVKAQRGARPGGAECTDRSSEGTVFGFQRGTVAQRNLQGILSRHSGGTQGLPAAEAGSVTEEGIAIPRPEPRHWLPGPLPSQCCVWQRTQVIAFPLHRGCSFEGSDVRAHARGWVSCGPRGNLAGGVAVGPRHCPWSVSGSRKCILAQVLGGQSAEGTP